MAITSFKHRDAKRRRLATVWQSVPDTVFSQLGIPRERLEAMEMRFQGYLVIPGMAGYDADRAGNPLYPMYPQLICYCATAGDVAMVMALCDEFKLQGQVTCRSGGHSTAGYSVNNGIVIDVSLMNGITVNQYDRTMTVESGATWGQINSVLNVYQLHVPGGGCPDVGVAGFMQGGGYGFTSREFGMNCDSVLEVTVMLADGSIVTANAQVNPALWWAVCGGTGNQFGVLLSITYALVPLYRVWGFGIQWPLANAAQALAAIQAGYTTTGAPKTLGYQCILASIPVGAGTVQGLVMLGMFDGTQAAGLQVVQPLLNLPGAQLIINRVDTYANLNEGLLDAITWPAADLIEFKQAGYIAQQLTQAQWQSLVDCFASTPNKYNIAAIEPYGGAINAMAPTANAFVHRGVTMDFFVDSFFDAAGDITTRQVAQQWLQTFMTAAAPCYNGEVYQNYPNANLVNYRAAYWGDNFNSLLQVKQAYDPHGMFTYGQPISPYPEGAGITRSTVPGRFPSITVERGAAGRVRGI